MIKSLQEIIDIALKINEIHDEYSRGWLSPIENSFNLKKKQIRHICNGENINDDFYTYVNSYCEELVFLNLSDNYNKILENANVTSRIKNPDSRMYKILHYYNNKVNKGQVNINKCLNDLLGFRISSTNFVHCDENILELETALAKLNIKVHNSCKNNYLATHLYFSNGNNCYFPWELQIWNSNDWDSNIKSHAEYKQNYTQWPKINMENSYTNYQK